MSFNRCIRFYICCFIEINPNKTNWNIIYLHFNLKKKLVPVSGECNKKHFQTMVLKIDTPHQKKKSCKE